MTNCPNNHVRFGEYCYFKPSTPAGEIFDNEDKCLQEDGYHLWYPTSMEETVFIFSQFVTDSKTVFQVGIRSSHDQYGLLYSDYSHSIGQFQLTADRDGVTHLDNIEEAMIKDPGCFIIDSADELTAKVKMSTGTCPTDVSSVCKGKLARGYGYEPSLIPGTFELIAPKHEVFHGSGNPLPIDISFVPDILEMRMKKFIEIRMDRSVLVSGIHVETIKV